METIDLKCTLGRHVISFYIPIKTITSPNSRENPFVRSKRVKTERQLTRLRCPNRGLLPDLPVIVTFTRLSVQQCDDDNLPTAMKAMRDEIAAIYGTGDSPRHPIRWQYKQAKGEKGKPLVRVLIEPDNDPAAAGGGGK
jgi:hypothetical protein